MTSTAPKMGLAITALACVALTITSLGPASATPAASVAQAERAPESAATSGGLLYRPSRAEFTALREVAGAALTAHLGLNDHGQITGVYVDADIAPEPGGAAAPGSIHGFIRDRRGTITTFEVPYWRLHSVSDINHRGQIVGYYDEPGFAGGGGFLRDRDGTITTITYPGAAYTLGSRHQRPRRDRPARSPDHRAAAGGYLTTPAIGGAARDSVTSAYTARNRGFHGRTHPTRHERRRAWHPVRASPFGVALASSSSARLAAGDPGSGLGTASRGRSGGSAGPRAQFPAFLLDRGRYTAFEAPDPDVELFPLGINDRGVIVGTYENPNDTPSRQRTGGAPASRERGDHLMTSTPPQGSSGSAAERGRSQASPHHGQDGAQT